MLKFIFFTFLILWLSFKIAGFIIRTFLRSAGFSVFVDGKQTAGKQTATGRNATPTQQAETTRHVTDKLGDYVDFEEVK